MVTYLEFKAHQKKHKEKETPTGKEKYDGVKDFISFVKDRKLSVLVTDIGDVYAVGEAIIAQLIGTSEEDVDKIEKEFKKKLHWPILVSGHDPRMELRSVGRFMDHLYKTVLHEIHIKKGRRKKEW